MLSFLTKAYAQTGLLPEKGEAETLEKITNTTSQKKILETVKATEIHMALSCIARWDHADPVYTTEKSAEVK